MAHDLGYDLLRYAAATGTPLDAERRRALDERLSADMHAQCVLNPRDAPGLCRIVASLFTVGLVVNSWHQSWGPPATEPMGVWAFVLVMVVVLLAVRLPAFAAARRSRPGRRPRRPRAPGTSRSSASSRWARSCWPRPPWRSRRCCPRPRPRCGR
ncbi:hypothetical protein ACFQV2_07130 [Actinokineospora soli]|uniref:Uncharacterized protein n=1 Tax=Actinokineospora soli TaxID=1048753 RepID=A0ABW2TI61_9PSEU